ncbi:MAG TPA: phytanoyl-CoA dioxygenase family protein [Acidimicrobiales bacterium]|nr:phytanoyl-CoA dioxygenase family protein [Acidimicrobiales bacterium]
MTKDGDFKRHVRDRAARTGESYQTALRQLRPDTSAAEALDDATLVDSFERTGIVKLTGVFSEESAAAMREVVWRGWAEAYGVREDDPATWIAVPRYKTLKESKRHSSFRAILGEDLRSLADRLLGPGWSTSNGFGNLLTSFPNVTEWHLPSSDGMWHSDYGYRTPMDPLPGLRVFAVFGEVPSHGGGTLLVEGSHRMVERFVHAHPEVAAGRAKLARLACQSSNGWLHELTHGDATAAGRVDRFMATTTDVDGITARVVEACGMPGDVYVCHPWTIHCAPPNANSQPRFLRSPTLAHRRRSPSVIAEA